MTFDLVDEPAQGRYVLHLDGEPVGLADYHLDGDVVVIPHTEIDPGRRGGGLGAELVGRVLDHVRAQGRRVRPDCWYVARYIAGHPEYAGLVDDPGTETE